MIGSCSEYRPEHGLLGAHGPRPPSRPHDFPTGVQVQVYRAFRHLSRALSLLSGPRPRTFTLLLTAPRFRSLPANFTTQRIQFHIRHPSSLVIGRGCSLICSIGDNFAWLCQLLVTSGGSTVCIIVKKQFALPTTSGIPKVGTLGTPQSLRCLGKSRPCLPTWKYAIAMMHFASPYPLSESVELDPLVQVCQAMLTALPGFLLIFN